MVKGTETFSQFFSIHKNNKWLKGLKKYGLNFATFFVEATVQFPNITAKFRSFFVKKTVFIVEQTQSAYS